METQGEELLPKGLWLVSSRILDHWGFVVFVVISVVCLISVINKGHATNEIPSPGNR